MHFSHNLLVIKINQNLNGHSTRIGANIIMHHAVLSFQIKISKSFFSNDEFSFFLKMIHFFGFWSYYFQFHFHTFEGFILYRGYNLEYNRQTEFKRTAVQAELFKCDP